MDQLGAHQLRYGEDLVRHLDLHHRTFGVHVGPDITFRWHTTKSGVFSALLQGPPVG